VSVNNSATSLTGAFASLLTGGSGTISVNITSTSQYLTVWGEASITDNAPTPGDETIMAIFVDNAEVQPASIWNTGSGATSVTPVCVYAVTGLSVGAHPIDLRALCASGNGTAGKVILITKLSHS